jgi:uncharacterized protein YbaR (Trm112 family)
MNKNMLDCLCCPTCKNDLVYADLKEIISSQITGGYLFCNNCKINYEIIDGIPVLLPLKSADE